MTHRLPRRKLLLALVLLAVFAAMAEGAARIYRRQSRGSTGGSLVWFEDFRTGLTDKGLQIMWTGPGDARINRVAKGSATGSWPAELTHVAQNVYAPQQGQSLGAIDLWPAPAVGQYLFVRMLLNNALPVGAKTSGDHGFQTNFIAPIPWAFRVWGTAMGPGFADGDFTLHATTWDEATGPNALDLEAPKNTVLRLEWRVKRTGTTSATVRFRVYNNQTGTLLDESIELPQASTTTGEGASAFRRNMFGMSGQLGATYTGGSVYWGAVAARVSSNANDWIGPYPVAGVEQP